MERKEMEPREAFEKVQDELRRANDELTRKQVELETIYETVGIIHSTLDIREVGRIIKNILNKILKVNAYTLMVYDNVVKDFVFQTGQGFSKDTKEEIFSRVKESNGAWLNSPGAHDKNKTISKEKLSFMCIPLRAHNRLVGGFCTLTETANKLTEEDIELISVVATQMALAVENSMLYEMTKKLAITDGLTELYNYRYFQKQLANELSRAKRYNRPLSVIMLDVDDFKNYNDTYGHPRGDEALREIARILSNNSRESDIVARYGGEEFVVILPETDEKGAFCVAEKIKDATASHLFFGKKKRDEHMTLSLGVAQNAEQLSNIRSLIKAADEALYQSKQEGKNRITIAKH